MSAQGTPAIASQSRIQLRIPPVVLTRVRRRCSLALGPGPGLDIVSSLPPEYAKVYVLALPGGTTIVVNAPVVGSYSKTVRCPSRLTVATCQPRLLNSTRSLRGR